MTKLNIKNLSYRIGEKIILDNISFSCNSGEVIAIVGKNGVGKTTLLNNILENINKTENIQLNEKANFGYVPQFRQIDEELPLSVEDFVALPLSNKIVPWLSKKEKQRIHEVLELTNSLKQKKKSIGTLSGGERQRLSIARAFLKDSPIVILDEISAALDVENEKKIQDSLNNLIKNKTVIVISHRLKSIENVDKIIVLDNGIVECQGTHSYLLEHSKVYGKLIERSKAVESFKY